MKLLKDILYKAGIEEVKGSTNIAVESIHMDSREVAKFSLFVAVKGTQVDGHRFIDQAIQQGAVAVVGEETPSQIPEEVTFIQVKDSASALGQIAANFYDNPSNALRLVGVTGTNGKSTIAILLYELFQALGHRTGLISTVYNKVDKHEISSTHTTPDAIQLNRLLREMVDANCTHCFMEVSSHALAQARTSGLEFSGGIFTNITHDHLDYHKSFDAYIKAKKMLFDQLPEGAFALVNKDSKYEGVMVQETKAKKVTYGLKSMADFKARVIDNQFSGIQLNIDNQDLYSKLIGDFNAYNLLAVYATATLMGKQTVDVLTALSALDAVQGRFQRIHTNNDVKAIVDYAHTPDALENVLETIAKMKMGNEKVITVVGCGGDRDKEKRPMMGKIACTLSDQVIFTSDNPRSEKPEDIIKEMSGQLDPVDKKKVLSIVDRKEAIKTACSLAGGSDVILVAGKGHEKYQEIAGERKPFDDAAILNETFNMLTK